MMSNEDPSETAVSRDARNEKAEQPSVADNTAETESEADKVEAAAEEQDESQQPVVNHVNGQVSVTK